MEEIGAAIGQGALIDPDRVDMSGFDLALLSVFFISFAALAVIQLANLFGGRFILFSGLTLGALGLSLGVRHLDFTGFCADTQSALVCGDRASGLSAFIMIWVWVSLSVAPMFALSRFLQRWRGGD